MAPQLPSNSNVTIEMSSSAPSPELFLEGTMAKVFHALKRSGLTDDQALDGMREMQNEGILFRERFKL